MQYDIFSDFPELPLTFSVGLCTRKVYLVGMALDEAQAILARYNTKDALQERNFMHRLVAETFRLEQKLLFILSFCW